MTGSVPVGSSRNRSISTATRATANLISSVTHTAIWVRVLPHFYAPKSWGLPLNLGFVAEFSFERRLFDQDTRQVELRGVVEKHIGRLQMDGNIVFDRALHGPVTELGWGVDPSARIGWQQWRTLTPSIEYYSAVGSLGKLAPLANQTHLVFPGADWKIREKLTWSFGVGVGR